jgi:hypothetical protein
MPAIRSLIAAVSVDVKLESFEHSTIDSVELSRLDISRRDNSRAAPTTRNPFEREPAGGLLGGPGRQGDSKRGHYMGRNNGVELQQGVYGDYIGQMQSTTNLIKHQPLGATRALSASTFGQRPASSASLISPKKP